MHCGRTEASSANRVVPPSRAQRTSWSWWPKLRCTLASGRARARRTPRASRDSRPGSGRSPHNAHVWSRFRRISQDDDLELAHACHIFCGYRDRVASSQESRGPSAQMPWPRREVRARHDEKKLRKSDEFKPQAPNPKP